MSPEAQKAIHNLVAVTRNDPETVRALCEVMGAEPAEVAHMAIARMYRDLHPNEFNDDAPTEIERNQPAVQERESLDASIIIEQLQAAGERQQAIKEKYAP